jgi:hypothetical protein
MPSGAGSVTRLCVLPVTPSHPCVVTLVRPSFRWCRQAAVASLPGLSLVQRLEKPLQTRGYRAVVAGQIDEAQASTDGGYGLTPPACLCIRRW